LDLGLVFIDTMMEKTLFFFCESNVHWIYITYRDIFINVDDDLHWFV
jgi:hypothetical protein